MRQELILSRGFYIMQILARSQHILNVVVMNGLFEGANLNQTLQTAVNNLDSATTTPRILFLDFMQRGDLDKLLRKMNSREEIFPRSILWRLFECRELQV